MLDPALLIITIFIRMLDPVLLIFMGAVGGAAKRNPYAAIPIGAAIYTTFAALMLSQSGEIVTAGFIGSCLISALLIGTLGRWLVGRFLDKKQSPAPKPESQDHVFKRQPWE